MSEIDGSERLGPLGLGTGCPGNASDPRDRVAGAGANDPGAAGVRIGMGDDRPTVVVVGIDADADGKPDVVSADAEVFGRMMRNQGSNPVRESGG